MRDYPTSGYIVPLNDFNKVFNEEQQGFLEGLLEEGDTESITEWFGDNVPKEFPACSIFCPSDTDTVDKSMEEGEYYVIFDQEDLFITKKTDAHEALNKAGIKPNLAHWSIWG
jgi:hypothetical protein